MPHSQEAQCGVTRSSTAMSKTSLLEWVLCPCGPVSGIILPLRHHRTSYETDHQFLDCSQDTICFYSHSTLYICSIGLCIRLTPAGRPALRFPLELTLEFETREPLSLLRFSSPSTRTPPGQSYFLPEPFLSCGKDLNFHLSPALLNLSLCCWGLCTVLFVCLLFSRQGFTV